MKISTITTLGLAIAVPAVLLAAGLTTARAESDKGVLTAQTFVTKAVKDGMLQIQLGQLAADHAESDAVKEFAQRMVDDHTKTNEELTTLAEKKAWEVPKEMGGGHESIKNQLERLDGKMFDREYMKMMVKDHEETVGVFRRYSESGDDPELKDWATKTLPDLESHETMAKTAAQGLEAKADQ